MNGRVNARLEAELPLRVYGPSGGFQDVTCVIDTGFTEKITLPDHIISALVLDYFMTSQMVMADGTILDIDRYDAEIEWFGHRRPVVVAAVGSVPLIGMGLLAGHELRVEAVVGGAVEIKPLPTP
jgi:clan AA aspartic protease